MAQQVTADVLLGLAALLVGASSLGVLLMPDVFRKLHYVAPAAVVAPTLVALAVTVKMGWAANTTDTWLAVVFMAATSPVLTHATARAARVRSVGSWTGRRTRDRSEEGRSREEGR